MIELGISWYLFASQNKFHQNSLFGCSIHTSWDGLGAEWATLPEWLFHSKYLPLEPPATNSGLNPKRPWPSIGFTIADSYCWSFGRWVFYQYLLCRTLRRSEWKSLVTMGELECVYLGCCWWKKSCTQLRLAVYHIIRISSFNSISPSTSKQQGYH